MQLMKRLGCQNAVIAKLANRMSMIGRVVGAKYVGQQEITFGTGAYAPHAAPREIKTTLGMIACAAYAGNQGMKETKATNGMGASVLNAEQQEIMPIMTWMAVNAKNATKHITIGNIYGHIQNGVTVSVVKKLGTYMSVKDVITA